MVTVQFTKVESGNFALDFAPMADLDHLDQPCLVVDRVHDAIVTLPKPVVALKPGKLPFSAPGGRGSAASPRMRVTMRCRSFFVLLVSMRSISFAADGLIASLYSATPPQALNERLEGQAALALALFNCREVLGVFRQRGFDRFDDHFRDRAIRGCGSSFTNTRSGG